MVVTILLVFLLLLGVLGAWNYQRNLALEVPQPRPFRGYSDADLRVLEAAQRAEVAARDARYAALAARRVEVRDAGFGQAAADEFERVHQMGKRSGPDDPLDLVVRKRLTLE